MEFKIEGIWSPMPTPLDRYGKVDIPKIGAVVDYLIEGGIDGLFPLGTTGEFAMLDREERRTVIREVVESAGKRVPVLAGISDPSLENIIEFARDASAAGADGLVATPPYYYSVGDEGIVNHYRNIHEHVELPLLIYNIPEWTHNPVSPTALKELTDEDIVAGMKYTENNLFNLLRYIDVAGDRIAIFTGSDAMALTCLEFGGRGAVVSMSNVWPAKAASIFDHYREGRIDEARKAQKELLPVIEAVGIGHFPAGLKEAMAQVGMNVGGVKKPLEQASRKERNDIRRLLEKTGLSLNRRLRT